MAETERPSRDRASLGIVYLTVFIDLVGFGIILPSLPFFAIDLGAGGLEIGLMVASYSIAQMIGASILGRLSDRVGRRPVIQIALFGSTLSLIVTGLVSTIWALILSRALAGMFGGSISAAQAYIADVTEPQERSKFMGLLGAAIGMGFIFGPALGAGMAALGTGFSGACFVAAGLAGINLIWASFKLKESKKADSPPKRKFSFEKMVQYFSKRSLGPALLAVFLLTFAFASMETTFALLAEKNFDLDAVGLGIIFAGLGIIMVVIQGGLIGKLTKRFGDRPVAVTGMLLMALTLILLPFSPNLVVICIVMGFLAVSQGLANPTTYTLLSHGASPREQGKVMGTGHSLAAAARAAGPLIAGLLYDGAQHWPYLLGGLLAVLAGVAILTLQQDTESEEE